MKIRFVLTILAVAGGSISASDAFGQSRWPIVFVNSEEMRPLGLMLIGYGSEPDAKVAMFKHNCYYYGDGGNNISLTEEFFAGFRKKGFSVNSLCLALQSPLAFDPATGNRLPSYQVVHSRILAGGKAEDAGDVSEILPIVPPDCFKRGVPYHDCTFDYDIRTGKPLSREKKRAIVAARADIDSMISKKRAANALRGDRTETMTYAGGREATEPYLALLPADTAGIPGSAKRAGVTLLDFSKALPLGYGYQLFTDGAAGPEGGDPSLARDRSRRASEEKIKSVLQAISDDTPKNER
jgi:hypothetical protein